MPDAGLAQRCYLGLQDGRLSAMIKISNIIKEMRTTCRCGSHFVVLGIMNRFVHLPINDEMRTRLSRIRIPNIFF